MITLISLLFMGFSFAQAPPPSSLKGQYGTKLIPKWNLQVPNKQATQMGGIDALVETGNNNILENPGFEGSTILPWTTLGTANTVTGSTVSPIQGSGYKVLELAPGNRTNGDVILSQCQTPPVNWLQSNVETSLSLQYVAAPGSTGDQGLKICAVDNSVQVYCEQITDKYINQQGVFSFTGAGPSTSGNAVPMCLQIIATQTKNFGADRMLIDNAYRGLPRNLANFAAGGQWLGQVKVSGCSSSWNASSASFTNFGTQTGCTYTVSGSLLAPATNVPGFILPSVGPGTLSVQYSGLMSASSGSSIYRFSDGINGTNQNTVVQGTATEGNVLGTFNYTAPQSNLTIQMQTLANGVTGYVNGTTNFPATFDVYYFPAAQLQAIQVNQTDYDWTDYTGTFSGMTPTITEMKQMASGPNIWIKGKITAASVSGSEWRIPLPAGYTISSTKQPNLMPCGIVGNPGTGTVYNLCNGGNTYITAANQTGGTVFTNIAGNLFSNGSVISFLAGPIPVNGRGPNLSSPQLVNSVISDSSSVEKVNRVKVASTCASSPCTITSQSGAWVSSITRSGTGSYTLNVVPGFFSGPPSCSGKAVNYLVWGGASADTATSVYVVTRDSGGTATDAPFDVQCLGPR